LTHANGILHARRFLFWKYHYLYSVIAEEMALMGFRVPGPEAWRPET
jgi:hypothetical protein